MARCLKFSCLQSLSDPALGMTKILQGYWKDGPTTVHERTLVLLEAISWDTLTDDGTKRRNDCLVMTPNVKLSSCTKS